MHVNTVRLLTALAATWLTATAQAQSGIEFTGSGFLSLTAGKILGGTHDPSSDLGYACPCFVSDYAQGGVYESGGWSLQPDSKLGLQGTAVIQGGKYSLTGQIVARGTRDGRFNLEWLYATAELNTDWTLQVGRKRLPLLLSSEVQDVGYALPWTHLPPQIYGWDAINYNGASLGWRGATESWLGTGHVFAGTETLPDAGYWRVINGKNTRTDARWDGIVGAEVKLSRDWFEVRAVTLTSTTQHRITSDDAPDFTPAYTQRLLGLSFNADNGVWLARAEFLYLDRQDDYGTDRAQLLAVGRRFGPWLVVTSYSRFSENYNAAGLAAQKPAESHNTTSLALRYDLRSGSAIKLQLDNWRDTSDPGLTWPHGDARLITIGYDKVF